MKTISTLLTSLLMSAAVFAADTRPGSKLTIKSLTRSDIQVEIDGKQFNPQKNILMVDNVTAGYHSVAVYRKSHHSFFNGGFEMVYNGSLAVKPFSNIVLTIDRRGAADIAYQIMSSNDDNGGWANDNRYDRDRTARNDNGRYEDSRNYNSYARPISDREFDQVVNSMQREWFETNRMKSAAYIISGNFFTADQVKEMMSIFTFENNKLDIAKQAYSKTIDKENYRCVTDALSFKSSKDDLARFIRDCE
jgi:hypothetical protein